MRVVLVSRKGKRPRLPGLCRRYLLSGGSGRLSNRERTFLVQPAYKRSKFKVSDVKGMIDALGLPVPQDAKKPALINFLVDRLIEKENDEPFMSYVRPQPAPTPPSSVQSPTAALEAASPASSAGAPTPHATSTPTSASPGKQRRERGPRPKAASCRGRRKVTPAMSAMAALSAVRVTLHDGVGAGSEAGVVLSLGQVDAMNCRSRGAAAALTALCSAGARRHNNFVQDAAEEDSSDGRGIDSSDSDSDSRQDSDSDGDSFDHSDLYYACSTPSFLASGSSCDTPSTLTGTPTSTPPRRRTHNARRRLVLPNSGAPAHVAALQTPTQPRGSCCGTKRGETSYTLAAQATPRKRRPKLQLQVPEPGCGYAEPLRHALPPQSPPMTVEAAVARASAAPAGGAALLSPGPSFSMRSLPTPRSLFADGFDTAGPVTPTTPFNRFAYAMMSLPAPLLDPKVAVDSPPHNGNTAGPPAATAARPNNTCCVCHAQLAASTPSARGFALGPADAGLCRGCRLMGLGSSPDRAFDPLSPPAMMFGDFGTASGGLFF